MSPQERKIIQEIAAKLERLRNEADAMGQHFLARQKTLFGSHLQMRSKRGNEDIEKARHGLSLAATERVL